MRWPRRLPLFLLVACSLPASAAAQTAAGNIQLNQYQPTPFSDRVLRLDGPGVLPFGQFRLGIDADYASRPLVLIDAADPSSSKHNLVQHAAGASLLASFGLGHHLELGLAVPLTAFQSGETVAGAVAPSVAGVGNVRLGLKARLFQRRGFGVGASLSAAIPAGIGTLTYQSGFGGEGRLFANYQAGALTVGARGGVLLQAHQDFYDVSVGNELTAAAGLTWQVLPKTGVLAELAGLTEVAHPFADARQSPLEALVGLRQRVGKTWFTLAGGPGLVHGYGSPLFRIVAGFTWANRPPDADGDGIPDDDDRCPTDPEDRDGFEDSDGCPDPDNDKDGVPDTTDKCPNDPEDRDGFQDSDGCPDPDNDKDGIPDATDKCPLQPETVNEFEDEDGCPDETPPAADKDKDGIPDDSDECPEEPEDKDGFEDEDGCPDPDNDKDGIPDATDKCPLQPETINGIDDEDGCPDKGETKVRLGAKEIETLQPIYFETDRSRVRHAFYNILGQIASLLKAHPEIGRCAIEGHTDDTGPTEWNEKLSQLRAVSVIEFLSNKGVDPKRLVPIGHGENLPWASNETPEGRAKNRRVVFHIEGVNPEEQKKLEQRQERRRRIRHRHELEQQKEHSKSDAPPPEASSKTAPAPDAKEDAKHEQKKDAQKESAKEPGKEAGKGGEKANLGEEKNKGADKPKGKTDPAKEETPATTKPGAHETAPATKPAAHETPAGTKSGAHETAPSEKASGSAPAAGRPGVGPVFGPEPPPPAKKTASKSASGAASPKVAAPPKEPEAETSEAKEKTEPAKPGPRPPSRASQRTPRKPSPDANSGEPPNLRDLLKLPPR